MVQPLKILGNTSSATTVVAEKGTDLLITTIKHAKDIVDNEPHWAKMSTGKTMFNKQAGYPYEETLMDLTADEVFCYSRILYAYDFKTGFSVVVSTEFDSTTKSKFSKGYKGLHTRQLVKRVKKFTYLINPNARVHNKLYEEHIALWNSIP